MKRNARILHGMAALVAWAGLILQLALLVDDFAAAGQSVAAALWRFLGFFTILTNIFVALTASAAALAPEHPLAAPRMRYAALVAILLVGIVYSLALRHIWNPQGWAAVADHTLHDATPLAFLAAWLAAPHGALGRRDVLWALIFPLAYLVYALVRGAFDGWYAYYFLDPSAQSVPQLLASVGAILCGVLVVAGLISLLDKRMAPRSEA